MDHVSMGMSLREVAAAIQHTKECCSLSKLGGINDTIVGQCVCAGVTFALQRIADLCVDESIWALSLAGNGSTHCDQHFFNLRLCVCYRGVLLNLHLIAIPQFDRHTALNTFNMLVKFLDALYSLWRRKLINVGTNGEPTMDQATQRPSDAHGSRGKASHPAHLVPAPNGRRHQGQCRDVV
ncbi:unnamed protein product [Sphagnum troendelagicum]|uniref:Uncharacterized protein n=1 Tax=Sphagnum troendelagicum TaxID=128251 RepID=A0ABP0UHZ8_9BRYO